MKPPAGSEQATPLTSSTCFSLQSKCFSLLRDTVMLDGGEGGQQAASTSGAPPSASSAPPATALPTAQGSPQSQAQGTGHG